MKQAPASSVSMSDSSVSACDETPPPSSASAASAGALVAPSLPVSMRSVAAADCEVSVAGALVCSVDVAASAVLAVDC